MSFLDYWNPPTGIAVGGQPEGNAPDPTIPRNEHLDEPPQRNTFTGLPAGGGQLDTIQPRQRTQQTGGQDR